MKKFLTSLFKSVLFDMGFVVVFALGVGIFLFFGGAELVSAESYTPLAPISGFTDKAEATASIGGYINMIYRLSIALGAVLAVLMIIIGGLQYMGTDIFTKKGQGRERIEHAIMGLGLLLVSFLVLQTINPELINLDLKLETAKSTIVNTAGITSQGQNSQSSKNIEDGFKRANSIYCTSFSVKNDAVVSSNTLGKQNSRCEKKLEKAKKKRGEENEYRSCLSLKKEDKYQPPGAYTLYDSCYYFKKKSD